MRLFGNRLFCWRRYRYQFRYKIIKSVSFCLICFILLRWALLPLILELAINFCYLFIFQNCKSGDSTWTHLSFQYQNGFKELMLKCIPGVPTKQSALNWHVPTLAKDLSEPYLKLPSNVTYGQSILILIPLHNSEYYLEQMVKNLAELTYPHHLINICFGEDGSTDNTAKKARLIGERLKTKHGFRKVVLYNVPITSNPGSRETRHFHSKQMARRSHLAKIRNMITKYALKDENWILWIDSDVNTFRSDVIQQFLFSNKDVMAASALVQKLDFGYFKLYRVYDRNSRRIINSENKQYSIYLSDLKGEGRQAKLDLVGACMLMIRADCVRKGLTFPEKPYIPNGTMVNFEGLESEGLGQLANSLGFSVYGLPFLEVYHVFEHDKQENIFSHLLYTFFDF